MVRYRIYIEYDGSAFCGWQRQASDIDFTEWLRLFYDRKSDKTPPKHLSSVQSLIEFAIFRVTHQIVTVEGAGRTDAGVHALAQCAHFDLQEYIDTDRLQAGLNYYIQNWGASILKIEVVPSDFHARFSAISRSYEYHIVNRRAPLSLDRLRAWHVAPLLNITEMQKAAHLLLGFHNFNAFRSAECQSKNPCRTLDSFDLEQDQEHIIARITARSFLHNQVRIMMGTLVLIGKGRMPAEQITTLLENQDRTQSGPTAPPYGLYLKQVCY